MNSKRLELRKTKLTWLSIEKEIQNNAKVFWKAADKYYMKGNEAE
jgi:hypothetical protein